MKAAKSSAQVFFTDLSCIWIDTGEEGDKIRVCTYTIDPKQNPKQIDLTFNYVKGDVPGGIYKVSGIYKINGDTLKICESDGERPTRLVAGTEQFGRLLTFKRSAAQAQGKAQAAPNERNFPRLQDGRTNRH